MTPASLISWSLAILCASFLIGVAAVVAGFLFGLAKMLAEDL